MPSRSDIETDLAEILSNVLGRRIIGKTEVFFYSELDSLMLFNLVLQIEDRWSISVLPQMVIDRPTLASLSDAIEEQLSASKGQSIG